MTYRPERRTALVSQEHARFNIDAAIFPRESGVEEVGLKFFWKGNQWIAHPWSCTCHQNRASQKTQLDLNIKRWTSDVHSNSTSEQDHPHTDHTLCSNSTFRMTKLEMFSTTLWTQTNEPFQETLNWLSLATSTHKSVTITISDKVSSANTGFETTTSPTWTLQITSWRWWALSSVFQHTKNNLATLTCSGLGADHPKPSKKLLTNIWRKGRMGILHRMTQTLCVSLYLL